MVVAVSAPSRARLARILEIELANSYHPLSMARMSNRDRIARAAEEARLAEAEKAAKRATKKPASRSSRAAKPIRMKVIWEVCNANGTTIKSFPYAERAAAEAETEALTKSKGHTHILRAAKVPME